MNFNYFKSQIQRLIDNFGSNHFKEERVKMIWKIVEPFTDRWLMQTIDSFVFELNHPPKGEDWRTEIAKERERMHSQSIKKPLDPYVRVGNYNCIQCEGYGVYFDKVLGGQTVCWCHPNPNFKKHSE